MTTQPEQPPRLYSRDSAEKVAIDERERAARILRDNGWSLKRIARLLGTSHSNIARLTGPDSPLVRTGEVTVDATFDDTTGQVTIHSLTIHAEGEQQ